MSDTYKEWVLEIDTMDIHTLLNFS